MAVIEEEAFLSKLNRSTVYSLSNDLEEIKNALYEKTGVRISDITEPEWVLNTRLAEEAKNIMQKHNVLYSAASWVEKDGTVYLTINHHVGDDYYLFQGNTFFGEFLTEVEPVSQALTQEIFDSLAIKDIIYAEYAEPGAMGVPGGLMLYIIEEHQFVCYRTGVRVNEELYYKAADMLKENADQFRNRDVINEHALFAFYGGGAGNNVFINKNFLLEPARGYFFFMKKRNVYFVYSSVSGVFDSVNYAMNMNINPKKRSVERKERIKKMLENKELI